MPVAYEWSFLEEAPLLNEQDEIDQMNDSKKKKRKKKAKALPINEVFDILPVSGILQPHETENVEFTYYAGSGLKYSVMASAQLTEVLTTMSLSLETPVSSLSSSLPTS